jgi:hypothetical protein
MINLTVSFESLYPQSLHNTYINKKAKKKIQKEKKTTNNPQLTIFLGF